MSSNPEVEAALAAEKDWRTAYPFVEEAARVILNGFSGQGQGTRISTTILADMIYNSNQTHDPKVRKRVFQALKACATRGLQRYCTKGPPETIGGVANARRLWWHSPIMEISTPAPICPTCKRRI